MTAALKGLAIFAYFLIATVWLPDVILGLEAVARASEAVTDLIGLVTWSLGLGSGMWGLRVAQRKGVI